MQLEISLDLIDKLASVLATTEQGELAVPATNLLDAAPQLGLHPLIREQIHSILQRDARVDIRQRLSLALDAAGDPRGLDHFIYCVLAYHPHLGIDQRSQHGWGWTVREPEKLNGQHIQLLVEDMLVHGTFHAPTLAFARGERLLELMRGALSLDTRSARYAAYVLAFHGDDSGRGVLKEWVLEHAQYPQAPLEALLALADKDALSFVEPFCDSSHPIYREGNPYGSRAAHWILPSIQTRFLLLTATGFNEKIAVIDRQYLKDVEEITTYNSDLSRLRRNISPAVGMLFSYKELATILAETCPPEITEYLCMRQWTALERLFDQEKLTYENMLDWELDGFIGYLTGRRCGISRTGLRPDDKHYYGDLPVHIRYERYDYLLAGTDWIRFPLRHRWYPSVLPA